VRRVVIVLLAVLAGASACDDGGPKGDRQAFCKVAAEIRALKRPDFASVEDGPDAARRIGALFRPLAAKVDEAIEVSPAEVREDVRALRDAVSSVQRGDLDAVQLITESAARVEAWTDDNCV
jgi:hypothetical protein